MTKPAKTISPARKEALAEIRSLERTRRKIERDLAAEVRQFERAKKTLRVAKRNCAAVLTKIQRRERILTGRLSA